MFKKGLDAHAQVDYKTRILFVLKCEHI